MQAVAAAGRLRVDVDLAAAVVHSAATGVVLTLLASPADARDPALPGAASDAVMAAVTTGETAAPAAGPGAAADERRAALPDLVALSPAERELLGEWLGRPTSGRPR